MKILLGTVGLIGVFFLIKVVYFDNENKNTTSITNSTKKIVAFGDGYTFGEGASEGTSYIDLVRNRLKLDINNVARKTMTTKLALDLLEKEVLVKQPDVVLMTLGMDDLFAKVPLEETLKNMEALIDAMQLSNIIIIYGGIAPSYVGDNWLMAVEQLFVQKNTVYLNPMTEIWDQESLMHNKHFPNGEGHKIIADKIAEILENNLH